MKKIIINNKCTPFGGFSLSKKAILRYGEIKGFTIDMSKIEMEKYQYKKYNRTSYYLRYNNKEINVEVCHE